MSTKMFFRCHKHLIHLASPINPEYTVCATTQGIRYGDDGQITKLPWAAVSQGPITCPDCIKEILYCHAIPKEMLKELS